MVLPTITKTVDPVCGREVGTDSKFNSYFMGHPYYFCSIEDKLSFDRDPRGVLRQFREKQRSDEGR